jgi:hypothetical protein
LATELRVSRAIIVLRTAALQNSDKQKYEQVEEELSTRPKERCSSRERRKFENVALKDSMLYALIGRMAQLR